MDGISYNLAGAKEVSEKIVDGLKAIATEVEGQWPTLISTFQKNWVGEDEAAFENVLARTIQEVYANCEIVVNNAATFVVDAANSFAQFQSSIATSSFGGEGIAVVSNDTTSHTVNSNSNFTLEVKPQTFDESTQRGLQSAGASQELITGIETFVTAIKSKMEEIYGAIDLGTSFVGSEQKPAMTGFIQSIGENSAKLLSVADKFINETIPELAAAYQQQQTQVSEDAAAASNTIADEVSSATGN